MHRISHPFRSIKGLFSSWRQQHRRYPKPWTLFKESSKTYAKNKRLFTNIILIVALPAAFLTTYALSPGEDSSLTAYLTLAQLVMNLAVVYATVELVAGKRLSTKQAYFRGSTALVRLILVTALLTLMLLPLLLGLLIMGTSILPSAELSNPEKWLLGGLGVLLALPSFFLITRGLFSIYIVFESELGPLAAIGASRRLTKGKVVLSFHRLLALMVILLVALIVPVGLLLFLQTSTHWSLLLVLLQIVIALILLPLSNIYLYRYYLALAKKSE